VGAILSDLETTGKVGWLQQLGLGLYLKLIARSLRLGEKPYEELQLGDNPSPTLHPRILKAQEDFLP